MTRQKPCPICGKPATHASRPFCSERCRDVDLNRWLSGAYAIPARDMETDDDEEPTPPPGASRSS
ncbi:conserved domain protein [Afipia carboxidovorans OM5]|uniref:DNA gyrase inhibitor YacG n=1 Tax=Afipia carboxidovorans TaxID=40137 RepID=UPI0001736FA0|nr:DNA gyrase inhibitor YacG [Afipia carboxidovorans]ACI91875.1 conserved domain protein [Afipia carboxidovorans OM5]